jgi:hypothetical protein
MKYIDYLESRGWNLSTMDAESRYCPRFQFALEGVSIQLYGWGKTADEAQVDLENKCEEYVTEVERNLNIELVP